MPGILNGYVYQQRPGLLNAPDDGPSWGEKAAAYLYDKYGKPITEAFSLPGDVYAGRVDPKSDEGIGRAFDLAGLVTLGAGAMPSEGTVNMGIKAFHGSPHDFDKFSLDKIGTGEGAQAYGHGLYFAENEDVAKSYRDALTAKRITRADGGAVADPFADIAGAARQVNPDNWKAANKIADEVTQELENGGDPQEFLKWLRNKSDFAPETKAMYEAAIAKAQEFHKPKGSMYEVNIAADPEHFLDWDKPLSEQPAVLEKLRPHLPADWGDVSEMEGSSAYKGLGYLNRPPSKLNPDQEQATRLAQEAGIPGIKYLDAGSRAAGDGSRNYVVFDDKLISIARKYGWVPGMAVPAAMMLELQDAQKPKGPEA